jgi:hypothetical protein
MMILGFASVGFMHIARGRTVSPSQQPESSLHTMAISKAAPIGAVFGRLSFIAV